MGLARFTVSLTRRTLTIIIIKANLAITRNTRVTKKMEVNKGGCKKL